VAAAGAGVGAAAYQAEDSTFKRWNIVLKRHIKKTSCSIFLAARK
jgi:hypothetical protein